MQFPCEIEGLSAVLLGNFNPSLFQPAWLAREGLVSEAEWKSADISIIRPEISSFRVGQLTVLVELERLQAEAPTPDAAGRLRDLVAGAMRILEHTPVRALGINRNMHFRMPSAEEWHAVGHRLAPKDVWQGLLDEPGTSQVTVRGRRPGAPSRWLVATVQPSVLIKPGVGVFVGTNEHFEDTGEDATAKLIETLAREWDGAQRYARELAETIIERCSEGASR